MVPHYVDFTFAFDTTLIRLEMTEIWPKYEAQASPPLNRQLTTPLDRVNLNNMILKASKKKTESKILVPYLKNLAT